MFAKRSGSPKFHERQQRISSEKQRRPLQVGRLYSSTHQEITASRPAPTGRSGSSRLTDDTLIRAFTALTFVKYSKRNAAVFIPWATTESGTSWSAIHGYENWTKRGIPRFFRQASLSLSSGKQSWICFSACVQCGPGLETHPPNLGPFRAA